MPTKPKRLCKCGQTDCNCHKVRRTEKRGTAHQRGYTARWQKYTRRFKKLWPFCVHCQRQGKLNPGTGELPNHIDHIIRVSGPNDPNFWQPTNHQNLCHEHHGIKTQSEQDGLYNVSQDLRDRMRQLNNTAQAST